MNTLKGRTLDRYSPKSLENCMTIPYKAIQKAAEKFMTDREFSLTQLAKELGLSIANTREQVQFLLKHKLVYLLRWERTQTNSWAAVYKAGNKENAPRPSSKDAQAMPTTEKQKACVIAPSAQNHYTELSAALVPTRTPQEQYEVNWAYWNYLVRRAA